jgi:excisionase family DNA binding protein
LTASSKNGADDSGAPDKAAHEKEILDFHEAAEFLGVSTKTFAKVLRTEDLPGRKVGREWKFSKKALLAWIGSGHTRDFKDDEEVDGDDLSTKSVTPSRGQAAPQRVPATGEPAVRPRTSGRDTFSVDDD